MTWTKLYTVLLVSGLTLASPQASAGADSANKPASPSERPNVILIATDDQGYGDFGATDNPVVETPKIDRLATTSASVDRFYVHPVCAPTRACLMTGRYNYRTRVIDTWLGRAMMEPEEVTVAEVLRQAGYATGIFGKWHLGDNYPMRPHDQGFEMALVHKGGGLAQPSEPPENDRRYTDPILFQNGMKVKTEGYCTDVYFDAAIDWIERSQRKDKPFFIYLPTNAPHGPFHDVPEELYEHYKSKDLASVLKGDANENRVDRLARILAMITNIDQNVGRLMKALEQLRIKENTLVLFMVDNGPNGNRYAGPFQGRKGQVYEGGIRSPLWAHWPGTLNSETSVEEIAAHIDIMPTILDACGVEPPADVKLDGRSLLPLLKGKQATWKDRLLFIQSHRGDNPVRYHHFAAIGPRWKLLNPSGFGRESLPTQPPEFELYNLRQDPGEQKNVADSHPDVANRLKQAYNQWFDEVGNTRPDNYAPPRIHVGTPHENPVVLTRQDWRYDGSGSGWARDALGYWLIKVAQSGHYDIRFRFAPKDTSGTATLKIDGLTRTLPLEPGATECTYVNIPLSQGKQRLDAILTHNGKDHGIYQADVLRR